MRIPREISPQLVNAVLKAREEMNQIGMKIVRNAKTDRIIKFALRYGRIW